MSPDKAKELISIYPDLFSGLDQRNCFYLFSFECGDGWFELLKDLITEIKSIIEKDSKIVPCLDDEPIPLKVSQVKEKYAGLRFYTNWTSNSIDEVIERAEERSIKTCEDCGSSGRVVETGRRWYKTLCEKCSPLQ